MTRLPQSTPPTPVKNSWPLQDAKARFSELVRRACSEGPQHVTVHGRYKPLPAVTRIWSRRAQ
ncbi:MAG: type II toxin-antitoxin system prevent-host-death family antitoxin [Methylocystaceae bacterium]|nr:type II toxin-antitoxin system prevent-host-death family antitoxin [Methylocystaceae bacterium]